MEEKLMILEKTQSIINDFQHITGLKCFFFPLTENEEPTFQAFECSPICRRILATEEGRQRCEHRRRKQILGAIGKRTPILSECHAGLGEIIAPCFYKKELIGVFLVYLVPAKEFRFNILADKDYYSDHYGIEENELYTYLDEYPVIPRHSTRPQMHLLEALIEMHIESGFLPEIRQDNALITNFVDKYSLYDEPKSPPSFANIIMRGTEWDNGYQIITSNLRKDSSIMYAHILAGRYEKGQELFDRLLRPVLRDENLNTVQNNLCFVLYVMTSYLLEQGLNFQKIYELFIALPANVLRTETKEELQLLLWGYYDSLVNVIKTGNIQPSPIVKQIMKIIEEEYNTPITLEGVSKRLSISPTYASKLFKQQIGVGFKWYLNEIRMEAAYNLLKRTDTPIQEIAELVGYTEQRSFYKMFKNHYGATCTQIRKLYSTNNYQYL